MWLGYLIGLIDGLLLGELEGPDDGRLDDISLSTIDGKY